MSDWRKRKLLFPPYDTAEDYFTQGDMDFIQSVRDEAVKEERERMIKEGILFGSYDVLNLSHRLRLVNNEILLDYFYEEWSKEKDGVFDNKTPEEAKEWLQRGIEIGFFRHDEVGIQKIGAICYQKSLERLSSLLEKKLP